MINPSLVFDPWFFFRGFGHGVIVPNKFLTAKRGKSTSIVSWSYISLELVENGPIKDGVIIVLSAHVLDTPLTSAFASFLEKKAARRAYTHPVVLGGCLRRLLFSPKRSKKGRAGRFPDRVGSKTSHTHSSTLTMWKRIDETHFLEATVDKSYRIEICDCEHSWESEKSRTEFVELAKKFTKGGIDVSTESQVDFLVSKVNAALDSLEEAELSKTDDGLILSIKVDLDPIPTPITWKFELTRMDDTRHQQTVLRLVNGLIGVGAFMTQQMDKLVDLLDRKDYHIEQMQETITDLGSKYAPRRFKPYIHRFDKDKWWEEMKSSESTEPINLSHELNMLGPFWGNHQFGTPKAKTPKQPPASPTETPKPAPRKRKLKIPENPESPPRETSQNKKRKWDF